MPTDTKMKQAVHGRDRQTQLQKGPHSRPRRVGSRIRHGRWTGLLEITNSWDDEWGEDVYHR